MDTIAEKNGRAIDDESAGLRSEMLVGIAKTCPIKYATERNGEMSFEIREFSEMYIGLCVDINGDLLVAVQVGKEWKKVFDALLPYFLDTDPYAAAQLVGELLCEACKYQNMFQSLEFSSIPLALEIDSRAEESMISLVAAQMENAIDAAEKIISTWGFKDSRQADIYRTGDGYHIGTLYAILPDGTQEHEITSYISTKHVEGLFAKIAAGCFNKEYLELDAILHEAAAVIEMSVEEKHPLTQWDLVTACSLWEKKWENLKPRAKTINAPYEKIGHNRYTYVWDRATLIMHTQINKSGELIGKEHAFSQYLIEIAKMWHVKCATESNPEGSLQIREWEEFYIGIILDVNGNVIKAVLIDEKWKEAFDSLLYTFQFQPIEGLIADLICEAITYQGMFSMEWTDKVQHKDVVTPLILSGSMPFGAGVDLRLVNAIRDSNTVTLISAWGLNDLRKADIYRTRGGYFIGKIYEPFPNGDNKSLQVSYMSQKSVIDLYAEIGTGSLNKDATELDSILQIAVEFIEKAAAQEHPGTPWDLVPDKKTWAISSDLWRDHKSPHFSLVERETYQPYNILGMLVIPQDSVTTPRISDGTGELVAGVSYNLLGAANKAEQIYRATFLSKSQTFSLFCTSDGYFIGEIIDYRPISGSVPLTMNFTYMNPNDSEALLANIKEIETSIGKDNSGKEKIYKVVIAAFEKSSAEKHPVTPWDLIP